MYIFGGSTADFLLNDLWSFNFNGINWKKIEPTGNPTDVPSER